jgi:hypothetical protein
LNGRGTWAAPNRGSLLTRTEVDRVRRVACNSVSFARLATTSDQPTLPARMKSILLRRFASSSSLRVAGLRYLGDPARYGASSGGG